MNINHDDSISKNVPLLSILFVSNENETKNVQLIQKLSKKTFSNFSYQYIFIDLYHSSSIYEYTKKNNILYFSNTSILQSYNQAILKCNGKYIIFIKAGDQFSDKFLKKLLKLANRVNPDQIQINIEDLDIDPYDDFDEEDKNEVKESNTFPAIPLITPTQKFNGIVDRFSYGKKVKGVDLRAINSSFLRFPMTLFGVLLLNETVKKHTFNEQLLPKDAQKDFLLRIILENRLLLAVDTVTYQYCEAQDIHFSEFENVYKKEWYINSLNDWLLPLIKENAKPHSKKIPVFLQAFALHQILARLEANRDNRNRRILNKKEIKSFWEITKNILFYIDDNTIDRIIQNDSSINLSLKILLVQIKHDCLSESAEIVSVKKDGPFSHSLFLSFGSKKPFLSVEQTPVNIQCIEIKNKTIELDGTIANVYKNNNTKLVLRNGNSVIQVHPCERFAHTKYFGETCFKQMSFHVSIPLETNHIQVFNFEIQYQNNYYPTPMIFPTHFGKISEQLKHSYYSFENQYMYYDRDTYSIQIKPKKPFSGIFREISLWIEMLKKHEKRSYAMLLMRICYWILHPFYYKKKIWFFFDKIYKGGDNAEYIYRYSMKQPDGISKYYLIDKNAPDAKKLKADGYSPVYRNTITHRMAFLHANLLIVSNSTVLELNHFSEATSLFIRDLIQFNTVCVQHGLSVQNIAAAQYRLRDNTKLYFCASPNEIENLSRPIYDYKNYNALKLTGVPRFDGLENHTKKQILLSPTWRMQAAVTVRKNEGVQRDYNPLFKKSNYYAVYNSLIQNKNLLDAAKQYGYTIKYVLHPIVSPQAKDFTPGDGVDIIPATGNMSYEELFCESSLMITDYSGVQFDFAYMRKPLLYYLPTSLPKHYEEGIFKTKENGFGEICETEDELVNKIIQYMQTNCQMPQTYIDRTNSFFAYSDHNNCKRIYKELIDFQNKL